MKDTKNKNEELLQVSGIAALFAGCLIGTLLYAAPALPYMAANSPVLFVLGLVCAAAGAIASWAAIKHLEEPKYDGFRKVLLVAFIAAICIFGGYAAQHYADKTDKIVLHDLKN